ncbi:hypothetical protein Tco_0777417 [Tanacetum coccineum]
MPRVPLSYQASACSLSTWHFLKFPENSFEVLKFPENSFEVLKLLENSVEVLKILENKLESMKILENKLESLKLQENQPVDGLVPLSIKKNYIRKCLREAVKEQVTYTADHQTFIILSATVFVSRLHHDARYPTAATRRYPASLRLTAHGAVVLWHVIGANFHHTVQL